MLSGRQILSAWAAQLFSDKYFYMTSHKAHCWVSADGFLCVTPVMGAALVLYLKPRGQGQDELRQIKLFPHFQRVTSRPPALPLHSGRREQWYFK